MLSWSALYELHRRDGYKYADFLAGTLPASWSQQGAFPSVIKMDVHEHCAGALFPTSEPLVLLLSRLSLEQKTRSFLPVNGELRCAACDGLTSCFSMPLSLPADNEKVERLGFSIFRWYVYSPDSLGYRM
jgi:hypothetical protein